jgi:hypothetical protein
MFPMTDALAMTENSHSTHDSPERTWKLKQVVFADILNDLHGHFTKLNVRYMPIKGAYLICSGLAEKMKYRRMDDIDILVEKDNFEETGNYLSGLSHVTFLREDWYFEKEYVYKTGKFDCHLEIHSLLNYPARFNLPTENLFTRAHPINGLQMAPCLEDALLIFLCHVLVHIGYELRNAFFDEIALISGQPDFSWKKFWDMANTTGVDQFIGMMVHHYATKTSLEINEPPLSFKTKLAGKFLSKNVYCRLPFFFRKLILEIPFVRDPLSLFLNKYLRSKLK